MARHTSRPTQFRLMIGFVVGLFSVMVARPSAGQGAAFEPSDSYSRLTDASASMNITTHRPQMDGWTLDVVDQRWRFGLVLAVDHARGAFAGRTSYGVANVWRDRGVFAGVRWAAKRPRLLMPYAQLLAGDFHSTQTFMRNGQPHTVEASSLALQPGLGVNLMLTRRVGVRVAGDIKLIPNLDWVDKSAGTSMPAWPSAPSSAWGDAEGSPASLQPRASTQGCRSRTPPFNAASAWISASVRGRLKMANSSKRPM